MSRPPRRSLQYSRSKSTGGTKNQGGRHTNRLKGSLNDVYEFTTTGKNRRAQVDDRLSKDEKSGTGYNSDGNEDDNSTTMKRKIMRLVQDEELTVLSGDDEEIDSDGAFEESDEERFAEFRFSGKRPSIRTEVQDIAYDQKFGEIDMNEDGSEDRFAAEPTDNEGEESESDPDGFYDVLDIIDGRAAPSEDIVTGLQSSPPASADHYQASEKEKYLNIDDRGELLDDSDEEALDHLGSFIQNLGNGSKRKALEEASDTQQPRTKKLHLSGQTETSPEGEFSTRTGTQKLSINDMLDPLKDVSSKEALSEFKKKTKVLGPGSKSGALSTPLPQLIQDRLSRTAAYEETKEHVEKWAPTMKSIREAEHLKFPLQLEPSAKASNAQLAVQFKPSTEMEGAIDRLLRNARLRENELEETENLQAAHLTIEEVENRRGELRQMRELMFRADVKAKRLAKIKSKTYRRIQKKAKAKQQEKLEAAGLLDDDPSQDDSEKLLEREMARARERATLRHKNTGKWAKAVKGRHSDDISQRQEIVEQLDRAQALLEKVHGKAGSEEEGDSSDDEGSNPEEQQMTALKQMESLISEAATSWDDSGKGVLSMKFMKDAEARRQQALHTDIEVSREDLGIPSENGDEEIHSSRKMVFKPSNSAQQFPSFTAPTTVSQKSDAEDNAMSLEEGLLQGETEVQTTFVDNPWLKSGERSTKVSCRKNVIVQSKDSGRAEKAGINLRRRLMESDPKRNQAESEAIVEISLENSLTRPIAKQSPMTRSSAAPRAVDDRSESESEDGEMSHQERLLSNKRGKNALRQRDLVALAFAGDNVTQEFAKVKDLEENTAKVLDSDNVLPGWGSWTGPGSKTQGVRAPSKKDKQSNGTHHKRLDSDKSHLIINHKKDKKAAKFQVRDVPYPYTSKAQYEQSFAAPLGQDWNSQTSFQRATLPRVMKKMGTVIEPLHILGA